MKGTISSYRSRKILLVTNKDNEIPPKFEKKYLTVLEQNIFKRENKKNHRSKNSTLGVSKVWLPFSGLTGCRYVENSQRIKQTIEKTGSSFKISFLCKAVKESSNQNAILIISFSLLVFALFLE